MEKKELEKLKKEELLNLVRKKSIKKVSGLKKDELINKLLKFFKRAEKVKTVPKAKKTPAEPEKIKSRRKTAVRKKGTAGKAPIVKTKQGARKTAVSRKETAGKTPAAFEQEYVEAAKFDLGSQKVQDSDIFTREETGIPSRYQEDRFVLLVRDPWWLYGYWEITLDKWDQVRSQVSDKNAKEVLRVYDVTGISGFRGNNANSFFDIELTPFIENWYIHANQPGKSFCAEIGLKTSDSKFYPLIRSNTVTTPRYGMSDITDEEWMISEEDYWRMFGLAGGYGMGKGSGEMQELFKKRFEEIISSGFPGTVSSWMQQEETQRGFWLVADAELIIYGATKPDAKVTVQGKAVKLNPDGSFSLRFALPDGRQEMPIHAASSDGVDKRKIEIKVNRNTAKGI